MSRTRVALVVLFFAAFLVPVTPAQASSSIICAGFSTCSSQGYAHGGYSTHKGTSYWNMYTGTNCTNYVAFRLVTTNGLPNKRPKSGVGNARDWGKAMDEVTDSKPVVGSVAWWGRTGNHVAYVEKVVSSTEIWVSESNWAGAFDWRKITKSGSGWPDGFIHFADPKIVNSAKPAILGNVKVGTKLTASGGVWKPTGNTYAYQWFADGKAISYAKAKTFTPTSLQLDKDLSVSVTATRPGYPTASAKSAAVEVAPGKLSATVAPSVAGTPRVDSTLTAKPGTWAPTGTSFTYQWFVGDEPVIGATGTTFAPRPQDVGKTVQVTVEATKAGYDAVSAKSAASDEVAPGVITSTSAPSVSGTAKVGARLTASTGTWSKTGLTYSYQWYVAGAKVDGATSTTYVPRAADLAKVVTVHVLASRAGYTTTEAHSAATAKTVRGTFTAGTRPTITGTARVGTRLTASTGGWTPDGDHVFRWTADGVKIPGATGPTFTPTSRERGAKIRVKVTVQRAGYSQASAYSVNTAVVATGRIGVSKAPTVTGSSRLGGLLTVANGTHTPATATLRYQWLRDGKTISGATGKTHRVNTSDLGHRLSARVTMSASGFETHSATTATVGPAKATSAITVSTSRPGKGKVTFTVRVSAPGVKAPAGTVTVRYASSVTRSATVKDGKATFALSGQPAGQRTYVFTYGGTSLVTTATASKTVTHG